jgi:N-glycosylase/DNA lyase
MVGLAGEALDKVIRSVAGELPSRQPNLPCLSGYEEEELWFELASCILGSAVSYEQATTAAEFLKSSGLLRCPTEFCELDSFECAIAKALAGRPDGTLGYRFPSLRARQIRQTAESIYFRTLSLRQLLDCSKEPNAVRADFVRIAKGIGPKQASLFLRNIGFGEFAVLDRHVIRFMVMRGLIPSEPRLQTLKHYENVEAVILAYADRISVPIRDLDLAAWIVARVAKRELLA